MDVMLFGKLPAHGDFVARGMNGAERMWWDDRLSEALAQAMGIHGPGFEPRYDRAAPWCFHIRWGEVDVSGAVAASRDRVGRRFPLVLARRVAWGAAACAAVLRGDARDVAGLIDRLVQAPGQEDGPLPLGWWPADGPSVAVCDTPDAALTQMLAGVLA